MKHIKNILIVLLATLVFVPGVLAAGLSFYHTDPSGTPVRMTDNTGKVVWHEVYKPFGEQQAIPTATKPNAKRFIGKELDPETGLQNVGVRYMHNSIGRFTSPDPVGPVDPATGKINDSHLLNPQRMNTYTYALNNPYRFIDSDGRDVTAVFDRSTYTLKIKDNQTGAVVRIDDVYSGNGIHTNNPSSEGIKGSGPLPAGKYLIGNGYAAEGHTGDNWWYKLYGDNGHGGFSYPEIPVKDPSGNIIKRGKFNIHTGTESDGCVTVYSDVAKGQPNYPKSNKYNKVKNILDHTKPMNYKEDIFRGTLTVK